MSEVELIGNGSTPYSKLYRWKTCGHQSEYQASNVRRGNIKCRECFEKTLAETALANGLLAIGAGGHHLYRRYKCLSCGHESDYQVTHVRRNNVRCEGCSENRLAAEAQRCDLKLLGGGRNAYYRTYKNLCCGSISEYQKSSVRRGHVRCQSCNEDWHSRPSKLYLLHLIGDDGFEWLKLGVAKNVFGRVSSYGLQKGTLVSAELWQRDFSTWREAFSVEQSLHSAFRNHRVSPLTVKKYMVSGSTECYPMELQKELMERLMHCEN